MHKSFFRCVDEVVAVVRVDSRRPNAFNLSASERAGRAAGGNAPNHGQRLGRIVRQRIPRTERGADEAQLPFRVKEGTVPPTWPIFFSMDIGPRCDSHAGRVDSCLARLERGHLAQGVHVGVAGRRRLALGVDPRVVREERPVRVLPARAESRRKARLSALCAHTNAPYKMDIHRKTLRVGA